MARSVVRWIPVLAVLASPAAHAAESSPLRFTDVSREAGLDYRGPTFAAAAADFDRDGWPDLAVSNHGQVRLFRNTGAGTFEDVTDPELFEPHTDTHGLTWLDANRDGRPDLYVTRGARLGRVQRTNLLYLNTGKNNGFHLADINEPLANASGRGRSATPWDVDNDGRLDLFVNNFLADSGKQVLALRANAHFVDVAGRYGWAEVHASDLTIVPRYQGTLFIAHGDPRAGGRIWRLGTDTRFVPWSGRFNVPKDRQMRVVSVAAGDVDNDGDEDLYYVRRPRSGEGVKLDDRELRFLFLAGGEGDKWFRLCGSGRARLEFWREGVPDSRVAQLGRNRVRLPKQPWNLPLESLMFRGRPEIVPGEAGLFLWHDEDGCLVIRFQSAAGGLQSVGGRMRLTAAPVSLVTSDAFRLPEATPNHLFIQEPGRFHEAAAAAGVDDPGPGMDALFADFDNDTRLDLYVINGSLFGNPPNRLYRNRGRLRFRDITRAAAARGAAAGRGGTALAFDYDRDGDLDLFLTNGNGPAPERDEGPYQLLRNDTRGGHWLSVVLEPSLSNAMALGARLELRVAGALQSRALAAGTSTFATSWLPVHFGMGTATEGLLTVYWPSGQTQQLAITADRRMVVPEPLPPGSWDTR